MADTRWQKRGLCAPVQKNYDPWFAEDDVEQQMIARVICMSCPVRADCIVHSLVNNFEYGIFGGLSPEERKPLREHMLETLDVKVVAELEISYLVSTPEEEHVTPSVEAKYTRRLSRAEMCYDEMTAMEPHEVPHYDMYMDVLRAVLRNPTGTGEQLGRSLGKSTAMFNQRLRECFEFFNLDMSVL